MTLRRSGCLMATLVVLLLMPLAAAGLTTDPTGGSRDQSASPSLIELDARGSSRQGWGKEIVGIDGIVYAAAPDVVEGRDGELFLGADFDIACAQGARFERSFRKLARLARIIESSGRRVSFTVAPNKTVVLGEDVIGSQLPHGECDRKGFARQIRVMDEFRDPHYLPLRRRLAGESRQVYWRTDPHWTTVGGLLFTEAVARWLDPKLRRRQHYEPSEHTAVGMLNVMRDVDVPETVPAVRPANGVTVRTAPGSNEWNLLPHAVFDHSWVSSPRRKTWPGRTLLLGDSFTLYALETMRPMFRRGRYLWLQHNSLDLVPPAIVEADTVIIEVVQLFVAESLIGTKDFRRSVRRALD